MIDFLGIGAQKAGTTWLYKMLSSHPEISFPAGKEVHYWDFDHRESVESYVRKFESDSSARRGEITPSYATLSVDVIRCIHDLNDRLRVIFVLRDPIDRAWSSARMALRRAEMKPDEASDRWFMDHFKSSGSLVRGDYESAIRRWRAVFGSEAILLLRFEEMATDPRVFLSRCADHIGVESEYFANVPQRVLSRKVFSGEPMPIRASLVPVLRDLYLEKIERLEAYLGWDLSEWVRM